MSVEDVYKHPSKYNEIKLIFQNKMTQKNINLMDHYGEKFC